LLPEFGAPVLEESRPPRNLVTDLTVPATLCDTKCLCKSRVDCSIQAYDGRDTTATVMWGIPSFGQLVNNLDLALVGVDRRLRVRLVTPAARRLTNLLQGDIGQPLGRRQWTIELSGLETLVRDSVRRAATTILDVRDGTGRWRTLSIRPYRSVAGRVDGALLALSDAHALPPSPVGGAAAAEHELEQQMAVAETLAASSSLRGGAQVLVELLSRSGGWSGGELWTLDSLSNELRPAGAWHDPGLPPVKTHALGSLGGAQGAVLARTVASGGKSAWIVRRHGIGGKRAARTTGWQTALAVPMMHEAHVVGALLLLDHEGRPRDDAFARRLERVGRYVGAWVEHNLVDDALRARGDAYQRLCRRLLHLRDEDRRLIARDLHDSAAQQLAALAMNLDLLSRSIDRGDRHGRQTLAESLALANECAKEIRTLTHLYPPLLDYKGLAAAVRWYVTDFSRRTGIRVDASVADLERLPVPLEQALYEIIRESLTNVHRHAHCRRASLAVRRQAGAVTVVVRDRGLGFSEDVANGPAGGERVGVGIPSMRERIRELGGEFAITSGPTGTTVRVRALLTGT
jgi:signal transduction histidine kinase